MKAISLTMLIVFFSQTVAFGSDLRSGSSHRGTHGKRMDSQFSDLKLSLIRQIDGALASEAYSGSNGEKNFLADAKIELEKTIDVIEKITDADAVEIIKKTKLVNNSRILSDKEFVIAKFKADTESGFENLKNDLRKFKSVKSFLKDKKLKLQTKGGGDAIFGLFGIVALIYILVSTGSLPVILGTIVLVGLFSSARL